MNSGADPSDDMLMLAWTGGDVAAFERLYARHRAPLYRFLLRHLRDPALADELFQDVWQRVIAARTGWRPEAAFRTWLFRIAHNRLGDHWRALRHRPAAPDAPPAALDARVLAAAASGPAPLPPGASAHPRARRPGHACAMKRTR
jgi:DNA-directed RNA polymerase specialized sigma24 family protein